MHTSACINLFNFQYTDLKVVTALRHLLNNSRLPPSNRDWDNLISETNQTQGSAFSSFFKPQHPGITWLTPAYLYSATSDKLMKPFGHAGNGEGGLWDSSTPLSLNAGILNKPPFASTNLVSQLLAHGQQAAAPESGSTHLNKSSISCLGGAGNTAVAFNFTCIV